MMMNTTPSVAEIDATMNLLSVLELAKDATKLKSALQEVKDAHDAAAAERKAADKAIAEAQARADAVARQEGLLDQRQAKIDAEHAKNQKNADDIAADRAAMRDERDRFDRWMAEQREALAADKARVESDAVANTRRAEELQATEAAAAARVRDAEVAIKAADAKRGEYEAKMANLKAMVS